jgi:hypothetical protein
MELYVVGFSSFMQVFKPILKFLAKLQALLHALLLDFDSLPTYVGTLNGKLSIVLAFRTTSVQVWHYLLSRDDYSICLVFEGQVDAVAICTLGHFGLEVERIAVLNESRGRK